MKKIYVSKNNFWVGEINKEIKLNVQVSYDDETGVLILEDKNYTVKNLSSVIKAEWLVPVDGKYPKLDGPVGETEEQAIERRRKVRFVEQAKEVNKNKLIKDDREVAKVIGCIDETKDSVAFADALGLEPEKNIKGKYTTELIEDDTKVVKEGILFEDKEIKQIKKALNQEPKEKKQKESTYELFSDHYDAATKQVGKYSGEESIDNLVKTWPQLHWTKKEAIIKTASKEFLKEIKTLESSEKIVGRIAKRLESL